MPPLTNGEFLARILPRDGWKCVAVFRGEQRRHQFTKDFAALENIIANQDIFPENVVYHGCASYKTNESRLASNVEQLKSLWMDIDAGPKKPYATQEEARAALAQFVADTGLPEPLEVSSGVGLHAYFPFTEPVSYDEWKPVADSLKALARARGLQIDNSRTGDAASILRPPGSHHRKDPENVRAVVVLSAGDTTGFAVLSAQLSALNPTSKAQYPLGNSGHTVEAHRGAGVAASVFLGGLDGPPASPDLVADQCAQIGHVRAVRGNAISEPLWHAALGALAFCVEGREVSHEWSDGDPRYDEAEVDDKVDRALQLTGPTLCARFDELNPQGCAGCPFKGTIKSPVQLGRGSVRIETEIKQAVQADTSFSVQSLPAPPGAFSWSSIGALTFKTETADGRGVFLTVTNYPVIVHALNRGEITAQKHSIVLRYWRPHDGWAEAEVPLKTLFGSNGSAEIAGLSIIIHNQDLWKQYLRESIDILTSKERARVQYEQFGWKEEETAFLVGSRLYHGGGALDIAGSPEVMHRAKSLRPGGERKRGSLAAWKAAADRLGAEGAEPQMVTLMMSLGAPLMRFFGEDEGGMVLSIVGSTTGGGKSTALDAAATVWGDVKGLQMVAIDTRVAQGLTLAVACNLPVIFDEARQRDPEALRDFIQMFTQGRDKLRGTSDGQLIHNAASWQTTLICGSNKSLIDTISSAKGSEAMNARILEFHLPQLRKEDTDQGLRKQFNDNPGWAGEKYMQALVHPSNRLAVKKALEDCQADLIKRYNLGSEHRFLVRGVSCMYVAALVATSIGIVSMTPKRLLDWTMREALQAPDSDTDKPGHKPNDPAHLLAEFLNEHLDAAIVVEKAWKIRESQVPRRYPAKKVVLRYEIQPQRVFITEKELRTWLNGRDMGLKEFTSAMGSRGILEGRRMCTLTAGTEILGAPVPVLTFKTDHPLLSGVMVHAVADMENVA
jgi:hypothetical protein